MEKTIVKIILIWISLFMINHSIVLAQQGINVSAFSANDTIGCVPLKIKFTSNATNVVSYFWDFGNGNTSTLANPTNVYLQPGKYPVTHITYSSSGQKDSTTAIHYITVVSKPIADFSLINSTACASDTLFAINKSTNATQWQWDFGDGTTTTEKNPMHVYTLSGINTVILVVKNEYGCSDVKAKTHTVSISNLLKPDMDVDIEQSCDVNHSFQFKSSYSGAKRWFWDFGDDKTSIIPNPKHTYVKSGQYSVSLSVTDSNGCTVTKTKQNYIHVQEAFKPSFTFSSTEGCDTIFTTFANTTKNTLSVLWNFGDGNSSTKQQPVHPYTQEGFYTITLTVTDSNKCTSRLIADSTILVQFNSPKADFSIKNAYGCSPLTTSFTNLSNHATSWLWNFGNGDTSTLQHPVYTYSQSGFHTVTLYAYNNSGCKKSKTIANQIYVANPISKFTTNDTMGCVPLEVKFKESSKQASQWLWDFGDGNISTERQPTHTYNTEGVFTVKLITTNSSGCMDTLIKEHLIRSFYTKIEYKTPDTIFGCNPITATFDGTAFGDSLLWDFGDGTTSFLTEPVHTYYVPGIYAVSLTARLKDGCNVFIPNYNTYIVQGSISGFSYDLNNCPDHEATFKDTSKNAVSWLWNFGDNTTSSLQNPVHNYDTIGFYTISLTTSDTNGCYNVFTINNGVYFTSCNDTSDSAKCKCPIIPGGIGSPLDTTNGGNTNTAQKFSCSPLTVKFMNPFDSTYSWQWDFGDGTTSNLENPSHTFVKPGTYNVKLIVELDSNKYDTLIQYNLINISDVKANYTFTQHTNCHEAVFHPVNTSVNANNWYWDFGDGNNSKIKNPTHIYSSFGNYLTYLKATDTLGCSDILTRNIYAGKRPPVFTYQKEVCTDDSVPFSSNLTNIQNFTWDFGNGKTANQKYPYTTYTQAGTYTVTLTAVDSNGCSTDYTLPDSVVVYQPKAQFAITGPLEGCDNLKVSFKNLSTDASSWVWNFGDSITSKQQSPTHTYSKQGIYYVALTAYQGLCANKIISPDTIKVYAAKPDFSYTQDKLCMPVTATFTDLSKDAVSWKWDFKDGSSSVQQHPVHTYSKYPAGQVKLSIVDKNGCTASKQKPHINIFVPEFTVSTLEGCIPADIKFKDVSKEAASWQWNFGEGTTSSSQHPIHTYKDTGIYSVTLIAQSKDGCYDTSTYKTLIKIRDVKADFSTSLNLFDCAPLKVDFTNKSTGSSNWNWNFGDGSFSKLQNPSHIYNTPGKYAVTLIVTNNKGCFDTIVKKELINVLGPIATFTLSDTSGCTPIHVNFTDKSINPLNWTWYFGDGDTSIMQNPMHLYTSTGEFTVTLIVNDTIGCKAYTTKKVNVYPTPVADYIVSDSMGCDQVNVIFNNNSKDATYYLWDFGDKNVSTGKNPSHTYNEPGAYFHSLIAYNSFGCSNTLSKQAIQVYPIPAVDFKANTTIACSPASIQFNNETMDIDSNTYIWNFGNGFNSSNVNPTTTYQDSGYFNVSLIATSKSGCSDTMFKENYIRILNNMALLSSDILLVTVLSDNSTYILWEPSDSTYFSHYILYRQNKQTSQYEPIAIIKDIHNSRYMDTTVNTQQTPYCYKIQTVNTCGNAVDVEDLQESCTIHVTAMGKKENIEVNWTPYRGCNIDAYEIYRLKSNDIYPIHIATLPIEMFTYLDTSSLCPDEYVYRIKAVKVCGNAISSKSNTSVAKPENNVFINQKVDIVRSTVVDNRAVLTEWKAPEIAPEKVVQYQLLRSEDKRNFYPVTVLPAIANDYLDENVDVQKQNYYYKIKIINTCMITSQEGDRSSSLLLKVYENDTKSKLYWTPYEHWEDGVEKYIIEKQDKSGNWIIIKEVDGKTTEFEDSLLDK